MFRPFSSQSQKDVSTESNVCKRLYPAKLGSSKSEVKQAFPSRALEKEMSGISRTTVGQFGVTFP